jgi:hypothetical protein
VHRFRTWHHGQPRLDPPTVDTLVDNALLDDALAVTQPAYVGRTSFGVAFPDWWLDYFDFGERRSGEHFRLAFAHTFANPSRELPLIWEAAIPEFANTDLVLEAYLLSDDGTARELNPPYHATPFLGELYGFLVGTAPALTRYQLKNPADWPTYRQLQGERGRAERTAVKLDCRMRDLLKPLPRARFIDKMPKA